MLLNTSCMQDCSCPTLASLSHSQVEREVRASGGHQVRHQAVSMLHCDRITALEREDKVIKASADADVGELHGRQHHAHGGVSEVPQDAGG